MGHPGSQNDKKKNPKIPKSEMPEPWQKNKKTIYPITLISHYGTKPKITD